MIRDWKSTAALGVLAALAIALLASTWQRLGYGVDFTDEAFYAAVPHSFATGNRPFQDERRSVQQTAAVLVLPLVRAHGTTEGLVLFLRRAWLALGLLTGFVVWWSARPWTAPEARLTAAMVPVAFVLAIPALSYNTIGMLLLTAGLFLACSSVIRSTFVAASAALAVAALALATFAYPTILPATALATVLLLIAHSRLPASRTARIAAIVATAAGCCGLVVLFALRIGLDHIRASADLTRLSAAHGGAVGKLGWLWGAFLASSPYTGVLLGVLALLAIGAAIARGWIRLLIVAVLAGVLGYFPYGAWSSTALAVLYATLLLIVPALREKTGRAAWLPLIAVPSIAAGLCTAWTSTNGLPNAAVGLMPAFVLVVSLLARNIACAGFVVLLASLHLATWRFVYGDDAMPLLRSRVGQGPYAGLRTTPVKVSYLAAIEADVRAMVAKGARTCAFYDGFPAGYLMSNMRPAGPTVWMVSKGVHPGVDRDAYARYYRDRGVGPDVVFEMRSVPLTATNFFSPRDHATDPFRNFFWTFDRTRVGIERRDWTVFERCDSCEMIAAPEAESFADVSQAADFGAAAERGWGSYSADYSGKRAAITRQPGAAMAYEIPGFTGGDLSIDVSFYSYGNGENSFDILIGDLSRRVTYGCAAGVHRIANVAFRDVWSNRLRIVAASIGQPALIVDRVIVRHGTPAAALSTCANVGKPAFAAQRIEAEAFRGVAHDVNYAETRNKGWASYGTPSFSGQRAVLTTLPGAVMRSTIPQFRKGAYRAVVRAFSYGPTTENTLTLTLGRQTRRFTIRGSGFVSIPLQFGDVTSPEVRVEAVSIAQPAAIVDVVELEPGGP